MSVSLVAPDVESLIYGLMPWLSPSSVTTDPSRSRSLSRSGAIRRARSPSLSPFWESRRPTYRFFQSHFPSFSSDLRSRPRIADPPAAFRDAVYSINCRALKVWEGGVWKVLHKFDAMDLMVSFPLRDAILYFETFSSD